MNRIVAVSAALRHALQLDPQVKRPTPLTATMMVSLLCLGTMFCAGGHAQTAHFSYAISSLGSGFSQPTYSAVDAGGNLFVTDEGNSAVYELTAASHYSSVRTITTQFTIPTGIAVDANDNLFVTDQGTGRVDEMLAAGGYTTVNILGSGFANPNGVAVDASGNVFVADTLHNQIKKIVAVSGSIPASNPTIQTLGGSYNHPTSVAVDSAGNVFVADLFNSAIKEIVASGGYTTVNTLGSGFSYPAGVSVDTDDNVYVADSGNRAVKEILAAGGYTTVSTISSQFAYNPGVIADPHGNLFVTDFSGSAVYEIVRYGAAGFGSTAVGTTAPQMVTLYYVFDSGGSIQAPQLLTQGITGLDFTDAATGTCTTNGVAHAYSPGDTCTVVANFTPGFSGLRYGSVALNNSLGAPIATEYIYGSGTGPQVTFNPPTVSTIGGFGSPHGVALDGSGNLYVTDTNSNQIKKLTASSNYATATVIAAGFNFPTSLAVDGSGNVFVADPNNNEVKEIVAAGGYSSVNILGSGFSGPIGVAVDVSGNVFVADAALNQVEEILALGGYTTVNTIGSGFSNPLGVAVDGSGNVFVADYLNNAVEELFAATGYTTQTSVGPSNSFDRPTGVALDGNGNLFVVNYDANELLELPAANGYTTTHSIAQALDFPFQLVTAANGDVFVADSDNDRVVQLTFSNPPSLSFASTAVGATSSDSPKSYTLINSGNAPLTFQVPSSGSNPTVSTGFTFGNSSTCPQLLTTSTAATLAAGASCNAAISFTPTAPGSITGSVVVTDNALNATGPAYATQSIALSGTATAVPLTTTTVIGSKALTQGYASAPFTPVTGTGGTGALTYTIAPTLPAGLSFSTAGAVSGTATAATAATAYTVTVTDTLSVTSTATFSLAVNAAVTAATTVASVALTQGHAATTTTPVTATGGTGSLTYSIAPALPAGLTFSTAGLLSGTPTTASPATTYTITVTDTLGATATATFSLRINAVIAATTAVTSVALTQGHASTAVTPVTATGGVGALTYTIAPALPSGLTFSAAGLLSGAPAAPSPVTNYTVTVTDTLGATATATFSLTANPAVAATTVVSSTALQQSHAAAAFVPVTATGGTASLTYSVSPSLPAALLFNAATGSVSGTPTATSTLTTYTVTATDGNGATATAAFSLTVQAVSATSTAVTSSNLSPAPGAKVILTATVTPPSTDVPPGTVNFYIGTTLLGASALNATGTATLTSVLPLGTDVITAVYSGSAFYAGSTSSGVAVAVLGATTLSLSASPTTQLYENPITLTAQVASATAGTPTGTVAFLDGTTAIAVVPINTAGLAAYVSTGLAAGNHSLSATYSGDGDYHAGVSTGAAIAITIGDLGLALGGDNNKTVLPGAAVTYNFPLSPLVTSTFLYDVHLTATGLPPGATYTFSPATIPAGSGVTQVALTIQTTSTTGRTEPPNRLGGSKGLLVLGMLLPFLAGRRFRKQLRSMQSTALALLLLAAGLAASIALNGCASGGYYGANVGAGAYTITVQGASAGLVRTASVKLTVE